MFQADPAKVYWDAIIIGTGMGGAAVGYALAAQGWSVLFCEKGLSSLPGRQALRGRYAELFSDSSGSAKRFGAFRAAGRWTDPLMDISSKQHLEHVPFLGAGTGGSTALYGGALERFMPNEFDTHRESWPFGYETLLPWYRKTERLFGVCGEPDPLRPDHDTFEFSPPPPLSEANRQLVSYLQDQGMHPYRLPIAADFKKECTTCQGYLCDRRCKRDSSRIFLEPALQHADTLLLDDCRVVSLKADKTRVNAVECVWKGQTVHLNGKLVILAAGALATPLILLASGSDQWPQGLANGSGMVGRNLMRHFVDLHALFLKTKPDPAENIKEVAFNDFYFFDRPKLGGVQSFGWMPPAQVLVDDLHQQIRDGTLALAAPLFGLVKPLVQRILDATLCRSLVLATTLEDFPYPHNRVMLGKGGRMILRYHIEEEGRKRIAAFRHHMKKLFSGWRHTILRQAENNQRLAHVCGTCRMGRNPASSVVDENNKTHEVENLYIVDASFFPSSGSTNPSLTIAANALRVAKHLTEQYH